MTVDETDRRLAGIEGRMCQHIGQETDIGFYATDAEYKSLRKEELQPYVDFFQDADMLIFDSMYTFGEGLEKRDWGHSSTFIGVDLAVDANVKQIAFFHHEPRYSDSKLVDIFSQTKKYLKPIAPESKLEMFLAYEGLTVDMMQNQSPVRDELCFSISSKNSDFTSQ